MTEMPQSTGQPPLCVVISDDSDSDSEPEMIIRTITLTITEQITPQRRRTHRTRTARTTRQASAPVPVPIPAAVPKHAPEPVPAPVSVPTPTTPVPRPVPVSVPAPVPSTPVTQSRRYRYPSSGTAPSSPDSDTSSSEGFLIPPSAAYPPRQRTPVTPANRDPPTYSPHESTSINTPAPIFHNGHNYIEPSWAPPTPSSLKPFLGGRNYYVITVGQQVGIFERWPEVQDRTSGVPGQCQAGYTTWKEAHDVYSAAYDAGNVKLRVRTGGKFDFNF